MNNNTIIERLTSLIQIDYDAVKSYNQAIQEVRHDDAEIAKNLSLFRDDHQKHIDRLEEAIRQLGGIAPELSRDLKGYAVEGMTSVLSMGGLTAALKAMRQNERLTNRYYSDAVDDNPDYAGYPQEIKSMLQDNYADEQHHLAYIDTALQSIEVGTR